MQISVIDTNNKNYRVYFHFLCRRRRRLLKIWTFGWRTCTRQDLTRYWRRKKPNTKEKDFVKFCLQSFCPFVRCLLLSLYQSWFCRRRTEWWGHGRFVSLQLLGADLFIWSGQSWWTVSLRNVNIRKLSGSLESSWWNICLCSETQTDDLQGKDRSWKLFRL